MVYLDKLINIFTVYKKSSRLIRTYGCAPTTHIFYCANHTILFNVILIDKHVNSNFNYCVTHVGMQ